MVPGEGLPPILGRLGPRAAMRDGLVVDGLTLSKYTRWRMNFSGIKAPGEPCSGNHRGAVRNRVELQRNIRTLHRSCSGEERQARRRQGSTAGIGADGTNALADDASAHLIDQRCAEPRARLDPVSEIQVGGAGKARATASHREVGTWQ